MNMNKQSRFAGHNAYSGESTHLSPLRQRRTAMSAACLALLLLAGAVELTAGPLELKPGPKRLVVQIHEVKCWDETTGKWREKFGVDTMRLATITIDPVGTVERTPILKLGDFDEDGAVKRYKPPRRLASFAVRRDLAFPLQYQAVFVLAEKDPGGGLSAQLDGFVKQGNKAALAKAKSLGATTLEAAAKSALAGGVTIETWTAGVAKEVLKTEALKWFKDDVFPPQLQTLRVTRNDFTWANGKVESPRKTLTFKANQGKYHIIFSWKLI